MKNNDEMRRTNKKKMSTGKKVAIWIVSIIVIIILAIGGLFAYAYHNVHQAYNKTYKKVEGTTKPKDNKYHMVVKVKGTKKDGSDDKLLYVTGTKGKKDFHVKKLQDGAYNEEQNGNIVDKKSGKILGNTQDSQNTENKNVAKTAKDKSNDETAKKTTADDQKANDSDTSKQDIASAKKQTNGNVNYYTSVNMNAAASAVDALGGLDVDGQHMNGQQVVKYYEAGHGSAVMAAAMNRKNDIKALFNKGFLNKAAGSTHTNMTWDQAKSLVK